MAELDPTLQSELDPMLRQEVGHNPDAVERLRITPAEAQVVGQEAFTLADTVATKERLAEAGIVSPAAALLELTNEPSRDFVNLRKLDNTVNDPANIVRTIGFLERSLPELSAAEAAAVSDRTIAKMKAGTLSVGGGPVAAGSEGNEAFDKTQRNRSMFEVGSTGGSATHESYASVLFSDGSNQELTSFIVDQLQDKRIVNLGGGNAQLTHELAQAGAVNTEVINVEPYPSEQALNDEASDHIVVDNPADEAFFASTEMPQHSADEVWAVYSVPAYLGTSAEIANLFDNVKKLVKPGGVVRIGHFGVTAGGEDVELKAAALVAAAEEATADGFLLEMVQRRDHTNTLIMTAPNHPIA